VILPLEETPLLGELSHFKFMTKEGWASISIVGSPKEGLKQLESINTKEEPITNIQLIEQ
jgi:hypothetical protein